MALTLRDGVWYRLPKGTRVMARYAPEVGSWSLLDESLKVPLYGYSEVLGMYRFDPIAGGWKIVTCTLTLADLIEEPPP